MQPRVLSLVLVVAAIIAACGPRSRNADPAAHKRVAGGAPVASSLDVQLGGHVNFALHVTNNAGKRVELTFPNGLTHDLVILDMVMNGMYGLEVLTKMRELNPDVRVIVATADIQQSTQDQVRAAGAAAFINKPLNRASLTAIVAKVLEGGAVWN